MRRPAVVIADPPPLLSGAGPPRYGRRGLDDLEDAGAPGRPAAAADLLLAEVETTPADPVQARGDG